MTSIDFIMRLKMIMGMHKRELSEAEAQYWCRTLESNGITYAKASEALDRHSMNPTEGRFPPKLADIAAYANGTPQDMEAKATEAWGLVLTGIRKAGSYRDVVFDDPIIHSTIVLLGGWLSFCMMDSDQMPFIRKDFIKTYAVASQRGNHPNILRGKAGWDDVMFIGDQTKCKALFDRTGVQPQQLPTINVKTLPSE